MAIKFLNSVNADSGVLYVDAANNKVGIGTTSPADKLTIQGDSADFSIRKTDGTLSARLVQFGSGASELRLYDASASQKVSIHTVGTSYFNGGNVGIGTTSPTKKLHVNGDAFFQNTVSLPDNAYIGLGTGFDFHLLHNGSSSSITNSTGNLNILSNGGDAVFSTASTERLRITSAGNVGIGTTSPGSKLAVAGRVDFQNDLRLRGTDSAANQGVTRFFVDNSNKLHIDTANDGNNLFVIDSSGNVGIGTTSPETKLSVAGGKIQLENYQEITWSDIGDGNTGRVSIRGSEDDDFILFRTDNAERMRIHTNGNVGIGTTSPSVKLVVDEPTTNNLTVAKFKHQQGSVVSNVVFENSAGSNNTGFNLNFKTAASGFGGVLGVIRTNSPIAGAADMFLSSSGGEAIRIASTGNVGIGTASPSYKLDISTTNGTSPLRLEDTSTSYKSFSVDYSSSFVTTLKFGLLGKLSYDGNGGVMNIINASSQSGTSSTRFIMGGNEKMRITNTGNVGIGTTSPGVPLDVTGVIRTTTSFVGNASIVNQVTAATSSGSIKFKNHSGVDRAIITDAGNVGIGTTAPSAKLHVNGSGAIVYAGGTASNNEIVIERTTTSPSKLQLQAFSSNPSIKFTANGNGKLRFLDSSDNERVTFLESGRVGIGKPNPGNQLHVVTAGWDGIKVESTTANGALLNLTNTQRAFELSSRSNSFQIRDITASDTTRFIVDASGNVGIGTTSPSQKLEVVGDVLINNGYISTIDSTGSLYIDINHGNAYGGRNFRVNNNGVNFFNIDATALATFAGDVSLADSKKLLIGTGNDLQIYHDATNSQIANFTGDLIISNYSDDKDIYFKSDDGSGNVANYFYVDGSNTRTVFEKLTRHNDNVRADFGTDSDLRIFHDSSNSYIQSSGTGDIIIEQRNDDKDIVFKSDDGSGGIENYIQIDGSEGRTLFNKNIRVNDNIQVQVGSSADLRIYHDGSNSFIDEAGTGDLYVRASDNMYFQTYGSGKKWITLTDNAGVELFYNDSKRLETTSTGVTVTGDLTVGDDVFLADSGVINLGTDNDLTLFHDGADAVVRNNTGHLYVDNLASDKDIYFRSDDGSGGLATYMYLDGSITETRFTKPTRHDDGVIAKFGNGNDLNIYHDGSNSYIKDLGTGTLNIQGSSVLNIGGTNGEIGFQYTENAGVALRHNNIVKFATESTGVTVTGDLTVSANLIVNGTTTTLNTTTVEVEDNILQLNTTQGTPDTATAATSGISIYRGDGVTQASLIFDDADDTWDLTNNLAVAGSISATNSFNFTNNDGYIKVGSSWNTGTLNFLNGPTTYLKFDVPNGRIQNNLGSYLTASSGTGKFGSFDNQSMSLVTNNTERLTINTSGNATFAGNVDAAGNVEARGYLQAFSTFYMRGTTQIMNKAADGFLSFLAKDTSGSETVMNISNVGTLSTSGNATFGGDVLVEDNLYLTDAGTVRGKIQLNSSDKDNLDIKAMSLGSLMRFYTVDTLALTLDASQNATFAGDITQADGKRIWFRDSSASSGTGAQSYVFSDGLNLKIKGDDNVQILGDGGGIIAHFDYTSKVGIGTTVPKSMLHVAGGIQMSNDTAAASADKVGTMRYRTGTEYVEVNGTELVTNGDFSGGSQDWTKESGWSIASGKASYDASSATNALYQNIGLTTGSVYKLSFTVVDYTSGSFKAHLSNGNVSAATDAISANGDYSFNITATGALVLFRNVTSFNGSIDNVSVIEVTAEDASYADMCMQTGASTYEWVNIVRNTY